jgi:glycosyltransferase involved in cell wall biosynthesis
MRGGLKAMPNAPRISVVMPVYNGEEYLAEAIESILDQGFSDFEFLIFDDGSTDRSAAIVEAACAGDPRLRLFRKAHAGYTPWLSEGLRIARGEFIARMDADDVARPDRFARQVGYLEENPECLAVGTQALFVDPDGDPIAPTETPLTHEEIDRRHLEPGVGGSMITHPSVMMRADAVRAIGGYRNEYELAEDLDLFLRLAERGRVANLPEMLLEYRIHPKGLGVAQRARQLQRIDAVQRDAYRRRGLACPEGVTEPRSESPSAEAVRGWIVAEAMRHGFLCTARKHAWASLRSGLWSPSAWRLMKVAWIG